MVEIAENEAASQELSSPVNRLQEIIGELTVDQLRYLAVRPFVKYDKEAAKAVDIAAETVSRWDNKAMIDEAVRLMIMDGLVVASEILRRHTPTAAVELVTELTDDEVSMRHRAAKEVLDRGGLPAARQVDLLSGGEKLTAPAIYLPIVPQEPEAITEGEDGGDLEAE